VTSATSGILIKEETDGCLNNNSGGPKTGRVVITMRKNCWDFTNCQRHSEGSKVNDLGICPAAVDGRYEGNNGGTTGGRYCWKIAGTFCGGNIQGFWARKIEDCRRCEFYKLVNREEGDSFNS
jgi:hypothetical protein